MIKLIGIDFDGTLLDDNKRISDYNIECIKKATKQGVTCILATGRPLSDVVINYHKQLDLYNDKQFFIGFNGTSISNVTTKEVIFEQKLNYYDIIKLFKFANENNFVAYIYLENCLLYNKLNEWLLREKEYNNINLKPIDLSTLSTDFTAYKFMIAEDPDTLDKLEINMTKEISDNFTILRSMPHYLEFLPQGCNKYSCLKLFATYLGIKDEEIMAIGDSMNDYQMIKYTINSVAMGNSVQKIKDIAKYITLDNNNSGVGHIINKLVLKNKSQD